MNPQPILTKGLPRHVCVNAGNSVEEDYFAHEWEFPSTDEIR